MAQIGNKKNAVMNGVGTLDVTAKRELMVK